MTEPAFTWRYVDHYFVCGWVCEWRGLTLWIKTCESGVSWARTIPPGQYESSITRMGDRQVETKSGLKYTPPRWRGRYTLSHVALEECQRMAQDIYESLSDCDGKSCTTG